MQRLDRITLFDGPGGDRELDVGGGSLRLSHRTARLNIPADRTPDLDLEGWHVVASRGEAPDSTVVYAGTVRSTITILTDAECVLKCDPAEEFGN